MRGGIDQPSRVETKNSPEKNRPHQIGQAAKFEQQDTQQRQGNPVPLADPDMKFIFAKIGNVGEQRIQLIVHRLARHDPTHMRPQAAIAR